ncbi:MAG: hypothetical protein HQL11_06395, partial [Candidatus Omnitrophica bacterium]|nr:hypothetical protein [Candidatus Omnitrophota bacterium]
KPFLSYSSVWDGGYAGLMFWRRASRLLKNHLDPGRGIGLMWNLEFEGSVGAARELRSSGLHVYYVSWIQSGFGMLAVYEVKNPSPIEGSRLTSFESHFEENEDVAEEMIEHLNAGGDLRLTAGGQSYIVTDSIEERPVFRGRREDSGEAVILKLYDADGWERARGVRRLIEEILP